MNMCPCSSSCEWYNSATHTSKTAFAFPSKWRGPVFPLQRLRLFGLRPQGRSVFCAVISVCPHTHTHAHTHTLTHFMQSWNKNSQILTLCWILPNIFCFVWIYTVHPGEDLLYWPPPQSHYFKSTALAAPQSMFKNCSCSFWGEIFILSSYIASL